MPSKQLNPIFRIIVVAMLAFLSACGGGAQPTSDAPPPDVATPAAGGTIAKNPSYSSPIAISDDDALLLVANTLNGTVSLINVAGDANAKLTEIQTGDEPRSVAISADKKFAYVTNQAANTVSVVDVATRAVTTSIPVGAKPNGLLFRAK